MNLILEISNKQDAELILNLVKRLNVKFKKEKIAKKRKESTSPDTFVNQDELLKLVAKPVEETLDVEALKRAQNWKGPDHKGLM
jgi:hypothetical protein